MQKNTMYVIVAVLAAVIVVAAVAVYLSGPLGPTTKTFKIGVLFPGRIDDLSWNQAGYLGLQALEESMPDVEVYYTEGVSLTSDIEPAARDLAAKGYDIVVGDTFQALDVLHKVAPDYPNTYFVGGGGYVRNESSRLKNVMYIDARADQSGYLLGVLAARMTKTNQIMFVDGYDAGTTHSNWVGWRNGSLTTNSNIEVKSVFMAYADMEGGRTAVKAAVSQGVDVIATHGDGVSIGAIEAAKEEGIYMCATTTDVYTLGRDLVLSTAAYHWEVGWKTMIELVRNGTFNGVTTPRFLLTLANGGIQLTTFSPDVPESVRIEVNDLKAKIVAGEMLVQQLT